MRIVLQSVDLEQASYSSVGRASDCRMLQQSDGPWFDSGWLDFFDLCTSFKLKPARTAARKHG